MIVGIVILVIALIALFGYCIIASSDEDDEREDEEQMEYLRKWREEHGRGRRSRMKRSWFKRMGGTDTFGDFKHHHESWRNSKKLRARSDRSRMKRELKKERDSDCI